MCATCFGLYLGLPQARHYKNLIKELYKNLRALVYSHYVCIMLKHKL